jgi:hypothetical protein
LNQKTHQWSIIKLNLKKAHIMTLNYQAITANCGNDTIGKEATLEIARQMTKNNLDFCVLNCQEVNYEKTRLELQAAVSDEYVVTLVGSMETKTKLNTMLGGSGMASFIIHKKDVHVVTTAVTEVRRDKHAMGTPYNKGGLVSQCVIHHHSGEIMTLELVSGHLDSTKQKERAQDWGVLQRQLAKPATEITNFEQLAAVIPNIRVAGYDANTRNKLVNGKPINLWESNDYELKGLRQTSLGNTRFSADSTYKTEQPGIAKDADTKKRVGYTKGGMLDFVDIQDGNKNHGITRKGTTIIDSGDKTTARDHAVVISPVCHYNSSYDFIRVRNHMAASLQHAAPQLSNDIRQLDNSPKNQRRLVGIYQMYLSRDGLLNRELALFTNKLDVVQNASHHTNAQMAYKAKQELFPDSQRNAPWFSTVSIHNFQQEALAIISRQAQDSSIVSVWQNTIKSAQNSPRSRRSSSVDSTSSESSATSSKSIMARFKNHISSQRDDKVTKPAEKDNVQAEKSSLSRFFRR